MSPAIAEYLAMGGFAAFVWPAYGVAALVLGWMVVASLRELRAQEREAASLERRSPRGTRAPPSRGTRAPG